MRIELCEDNSDIKGSNLPTLVILKVTTDDGKSKLIPYEASRTIQELYRDIKGIDPSAFTGQQLSGYITETPLTPLGEQMAQRAAPLEPRYFGNNQHLIEPEDTVRLVKLIPREEGSDHDLQVGKEYRVIEKISMGYEVLDDASGTRIRIPVYKEEVELVRKAAPKPPKVNIPSTIKKCDCNEEVALLLEQDGIYHGKCEKCGAILLEDLRKK